MKASTKIKFLNKLGLFNQARNLLYKFRNMNAGIVNFYSQFVHTEDLCFDIGANIGEKSDLFLKLGAKVIAVEPQKECVEFLQKKYRNDSNITIVPCALDEKQGEKELYICEANALSSMDPEWIESTKKSGRYNDFDWTTKVSVPTMTLDQLIKKYGTPRYCKIDVEGFEYNVIKGLTQKIPLISIEVSPESINTVTKCLSYLSSLNFKKFNHSINYKNWTSENWLTGTEIIDQLNKNSKEYYGDVFARP